MSVIGVEQSTRPPRASEIRHFRSPVAAQRWRASMLPGERARQVYTLPAGFSPDRGIALSNVLAAQRDPRATPRSVEDELAEQIAQQGAQLAWTPCWYPGEQYGRRIIHHVYAPTESVRILLHYRRADRRSHTGWYHGDTFLARRLNEAKAAVEAQFTKPGGEPCPST